MQFLREVSNNFANLTVYGLVKIREATTIIKINAEKLLLNIVGEKVEKKNHIYLDDDFEFIETNVVDEKLIV